MQFERRPLTTKAVAGQHTGDVHVGVMPKIKVALPPYIGRAAHPTPPIRKPPMAKRVSSPVAVSFWPMEKKVDVVQPAPKKKILFNLALLLFGCSVVSGVIWSLQGAGRGTAALGEVRRHVQAAYAGLLLAGSAAAQSDFAGSSQNFSQARSSLEQAQNELNQALATSRHVLTYADVTGTLRSGEEILNLGQALSQAGELVSQALAMLTVSTSPLDHSFMTSLQRSEQPLTTASEALDRANAALGHIASPLLPAEIKQDVSTLKQSVPKINQALKTFLNNRGLLLNLLGADHAKQYLLLFANNSELRPAGGFIGSIAVVNIDQGKVEKIDVQTVYDPDGQLKQFIAPPDPLLPITNRWYMRDANWFVDYSVSARKVANFFEKEGGSTVDGVVTITPAVIQELLHITGPIEVPAYNVTVTADNFMEITQGQVTYEYDKQVNRPKQFLADLTPLLLNHLFIGDQKSSLAVVNGLEQAVRQKDLLLYFRDQSAQQLLEAAHWAGKFPLKEPGFFSVNNANIGGHKSDQFIEQEIDYRGKLLDNGDLDVTATIRRTHHGPQEALDYPYPPGEDPAKKDNIIYQRVFVPIGAQLIEAEGFTPGGQVPHTVEPEPDLKLQPDPDVAVWQRGQIMHDSGTMIGQEADYAFFANWMITRPGQTSIGLYHYVVPGAFTIGGLFDPAQQLTTYIAKQAGDKRTTVRVSLDLPEQVRIMHTIPTDGVMQDTSHSFVYRGKLDQDVLIGAVYVRE